jgi:hypothetical protein
MPQAVAKKCLVYALSEKGIDHISIKYADASSPETIATPAKAERGSHIQARPAKPRPRCRAKAFTLFYAAELASTLRSLLFFPCEFFFTLLVSHNRYIALAHSRNYSLPALPRAFFCLSICRDPPR